MLDFGFRKEENKSGFALEELPAVETRSLHK